MKRDNIFLRDAWRLFFFLGIVMLNFPFLQIFAKPTKIMGIPILLLYFLIGWPLSIFVIYLFARRAPYEQNQDKQG